MNRQKQAQAHALIITVSVLFVLSITGITFANFSMVNQRAATNNLYKSVACLIADAGVERTVATMQNKFAESLFDPAIEYRNWLGQGGVVTNRPGTNNINDSIGSGIPIEKLLEKDPPAETIGSYTYTYSNLRPSFPEEFRNHWVSGVLQSQLGYAYAVKIVDTTSQININMQSHSHLRQMLLKLSQAIAKRGEYLGTDSNGPLHSLDLIDEILTRRPFTAKEHLVGISKDGVTLTLDDYNALRDYITIAPSHQQMSTNSNYANNNPYKCSNSYRSPININTASWPVLVAVLNGLRDGSIVIDTTEAEAIASAICDHREKVGFFSTWDNFKELFTTATQNKLTGLTTAQKNTVSGLSENDVAVIIANVDFQQSEKADRPEAPSYQKIVKSQLDYYTTEFCFFPFGYFEIISMGMIIDANNNFIASAKQEVIVQVSEVICQTTQQQFEKGYWERQGSPGVPNSTILDNKKRPGQNSFTAPAIVTSNSGNSSRGSIGPFVYGEDTTNPGSLTIEGPHLYGGFGSDPGDVFHFRAPFNGSHSPQANQSGQGLYSAGTIGPNGLIDNTTYYYQAQPPVVTPKENKDNLPNEKGTLMLWIKPHDYVGYTTVFFAQTYVQPTTIINLPVSDTPPSDAEISGTDFQTAKSNFEQFVNGTKPDTKYLPLNFDLTPNPTEGKIHAVLYQDSTGRIHYYDCLTKTDRTTEDLGWLNQEPFFSIETTIQVSCTSSNDLLVKAIRTFKVRPLHFQHNQSGGNQNYVFPNASGESPHPPNDIGYTCEAKFCGNQYKFRPREWYHLALRWKNYIHFDFEYNAAPIVVSGFFHDGDGNQLHRGCIVPEYSDTSLSSTAPKFRILNMTQASAASGLALDLNSNPSFVAHYNNTHTNTSSNYSYYDTTSVDVPTYTYYTTETQTDENGEEIQVQIPHTVQAHTKDMNIRFSKYPDNNNFIKDDMFKNRALQDTGQTTRTFQQAASPYQFVGQAGTTQLDSRWYYRGFAVAPNPPGSTDTDFATYDHQYKYLWGQDFVGNYNRDNRTFLMQLSAKYFHLDDMAIINDPYVFMADPPDPPDPDADPDISLKTTYNPSRYPPTVSPNSFAQFQGRVRLPNNDVSNMPYQVYLLERRWPNGTPAADAGTGNKYYSSSSSIPALHSDANKSRQNWKLLYKEANNHPFENDSQFDAALSSNSQWKDEPDNKGRICSTTGSKPLWQLLLDYYQGKEGYFHFNVPVVDTSKEAPSVIQVEFDPSDSNYMQHNSGGHYFDYNLHFVKQFKDPATPEVLFRRSVVDAIYVVYPVKKTRYVVYRYPLN